MEAVNMPIVIQQRKQNDYANANSDFSGYGVSLQGLEIVRRGNETSYRLVHRQNGLEEYKSNYSTTNFAILKDSAETTTFDTNFNNTVTQNLANDEDEDFDDSLLYGVQVFDYPRKVLFTQKIEINTKELKKRQPTLIIEPFLLEDEE